MEVHEALTQKSVVPISTKGIQSITIPISLAQMLEETKLPQVRGTLMDPHVPVKLGSTNGVVHWKIDATRLRRFIMAEAHPEQKRMYESVLAQAEASRNAID